VPFASSVGDWVAYLTSRSNGPQSLVFAALRVLRASEPATRTLLFVLPYVVQNVLCLGEAADAEPIKKEILCVLRDGMQQEEGSGGAGKAADASSGRGRVQLSVQVCVCVWARARVGS
jgi:hypothetical protein